MKNKKIYSCPFVEIVVLSTEDVITTSTNVDIDFSELLGGNESEAIN